VNWAPSYEYLDQVLLPMLEQFFSGFSVERKLRTRGCKFLFALPWACPRLCSPCPFREPR